LPPGSSTIDVVIQEMVDASVAGVAFSRDPANDDCVRVEAVKGIGEELVSGNAIPESYVFERATLTQRDYRAGRQYLAVRKDGTRSRIAPREIRARRLTVDQARVIAKQTVALEDLFPDAMRGLDVEWALEAGELRLLQCRPITSDAIGSASVSHDR
jgi:pyruvate,water dikinase